MSIKERFMSLFHKNNNEIGYQYQADNQGINFFIDPKVRQTIESGNANLWISNQHVLLNMLVEQGLAETMPNGFIVPSHIAAGLDEVSQHALSLPPLWHGHIKGSFTGNTGNALFTLQLELAVEPSRYSSAYKIVGPLLKFSEERIYLQTPAQALIFSASQQHQQSEKTETDNLRLILALQEAKQKGANLTLAHFDKLNIKTPDSVSIMIEPDNEGNLILTPSLGQNATHEQMQAVLWQLRKKDTNVLRVGNEIILLDEKRLTAVHEILKNQKVPKDKVKDFYKTPSAFLDASLVNLDIGFSTRVLGATKFKHAYFGETEESGIDWFNGVSSISVLPIQQLPSYIDSLEDLTEFQHLLSDAHQAKSEILEFKKHHFDISNLVEVEKVIEQIRQKLLEGGSNQTTDETPTTLEDNIDVPKNKGDNGAIIVDIITNDEIATYVKESIYLVLYPNNKLNWSNYKREAFPHQEEGIRWILGLMVEKRSNGCLLADDMGLGKTYMALAAIEQAYRIENINNPLPCLIVAPLSVLQNWKDEVEKTFHHSPFHDIVILQGTSAMARYRVGGVETKQNLPIEGETAHIRYSLKVGDQFTHENRLDLPKRLIITTYQTLRDYQFSLCMVKWHMVIFDEAQNIKNPNAIQTRAAKGLNSNFNLLVTGTPVENTLADFWCIMDTAVPGHLGSYQAFRKKYVIPLLQAAEDEVDEVRSQMGGQLRKDTGNLMLRRVKEDNLKGLPNKNVYVGTKTSTENNWTYNPILQSVMAGIQQERYEAIINSNNASSTNEVLSSLHRLRDVSLHPQLIDKGHFVIKSKNKRDIRVLLNESHKLQSMLHVLDTIKKQNEKVIIFCINKELQRFLSTALMVLYQMEVSVINGDTKAVATHLSTQTRKSIIEAFETKQGFNIIIMSPIAAGVGLTIIGANHVIHLERHWNPAKEAQASDRVYRIGQTKDVNIYIPILHHPELVSFDVNLHKLLSKKTLLKDAVVTPEQVNPSSFDEVGFKGVHHRVMREDLNKLSWQQFEALCVELFSKELVASDSWLTQNGSDYGADAALISHDTITLLQCKYTKNMLYRGHKAVQEVFSAERIYRKYFRKEVNQLIFVTNAEKITSETRELAKQYTVKVMTHKEIVILLEQHTITFEMIFKRLNKARLTLSY